MKFSRISEKNTPNDTFISILYYNEVERKVLPDSNNTKSILDFKGNGANPV